MAQGHARKVLTRGRSPSAYQRKLASKDLAGRAILLVGATLAFAFHTLNCSAGTQKEAAEAGNPCVLLPDIAVKTYTGGLGRRIEQNIHNAFTAYKSNDEREVALQKTLVQGFRCIERTLSDIQTAVGRIKLAPTPAPILIPAEPPGCPQRDLQRCERIQSQLDALASEFRVVSNQLNTLTTVIAASRKTEQLEAKSFAALSGSLASELRLSISLQTDPLRANPQPEPKDQMDPSVPILENYPALDVAATVAIVTVPDPRVPRHRRDYDNAITAISQGMLRDGFVLDRYAFPWRQELDNARSPVLAAVADPGEALQATAQKANDAQASIAEDGRYGLMIYRRDLWRDSPQASPTVALRALYVVPETATYGVAEKALFCALERIDSQMGPAGGEATPPAEAFWDWPFNCGNKAPRSTTDEFAAAWRLPMFIHGFLAEACPNFGARAGRIEIIGPAFSGSMDSIKEVIKASRQTLAFRHIRSYCVLSASATSDTNVLAFPPPPDPKASARPQAAIHLSRSQSPEQARLQQVSYRSLATPDSNRLELLDLWSNTLGVRIDRTPMVLLYEATTFGSQVCPPKGAKARFVCDHVVRVAFPANIADVRYGVEKQQQQREEELQAAKQREGIWSMAGLSKASHLPLEEGAENGSEFPESQQSPLTTASSESVLEEIISLVRHLHPQLIAIVATDVRDRLFLMQLLSTVDSNALLVDLGADNLSAHPDFMYATRGMLALSSIPLTRIEVGTSHGAHASLADRCIRITPDAAGLIATVSEESWCAYYGWSTEQQALMFEAVRMWDGGLDPQPAPGGIAPHVVTRRGLLSIVDLPRADGSAWWVIAGLLLCLAASFGNVGYRSPQPIGFAGPLIPNNQPVAWLAAALTALMACIAAGLSGNSATLLSSMLIGSIAVALGFSGWRMTWWRVAKWVALICLICLTVVAVAAMAKIALQAPSKQRMLVNALSADPVDGMAYGWVLLTAAVTITVAVQISLDAVIAQSTSELALAEALSPGVPANATRPLAAATRLLSSIGWSITAAGLATGVCLYFAGNRHITIFGASGDFSAFVALLSVTTLGFVMLVGAEVAAGRVMKLSRIIEFRRAAAGLFHAANPEDQPLLWDRLSVDELPTWVATPALAGIFGTPSWIKALKSPGDTYAARIGNALNEPLTMDGIGAIHTLMADELIVYRRSIVGMVACSIAAGAMIYFFPISEATPLTVANVTILLCGGLMSAFHVLQFEGDRVLSNVICNRPQKREWSLSLVVVVLLPFVVLAGLVSIAQLPGVLDSEGGLIQALLKHMPLLGG